jgi:hypothetical protein
MGCDLMRVGNVLIEEALDANPFSGLYWSNTPASRCS